MPEEIAKVFWQTEDLECVDRCPVCASTNSSPAHSGLQDYLEGTPGQWTMFRCMECGSLYLKTRPTRNAIAKAYRSYHTHEDGAAAMAGDNGTSLLWRWSNGYMNTRFAAGRAPASPWGRLALSVLPSLRQQLDYFYRHLPQTPGRLLDVGCGNGIFLLRARQAGWRVTGLEPDPIAVAAARRADLDVVQGTLDTWRGEESFDVITASHVIEHVHDPLEFLRQIFSLLLPGGRIWLATPNAESLGHRRYGRGWRGLEPPRHMTVLTLGALQRLLQRAGFEHVRPHRRGRGARYILRTSAELAEKYGERPRSLSPLRVDALATLSPYFAEECVVSAIKGPLA